MRCTACPWTAARLGEPGPPREAGGGAGGYNAGGFTASKRADVGYGNGGYGGGRY